MARQHEVCAKFHRAVELIGRRWSGALIQVLLQGRKRYAELRRALIDPARASREKRPGDPWAFEAGNESDSAKLCPAYFSACYLPGKSAGQNFSEPGDTTSIQVVDRDGNLFYVLVVNSRFPYIGVAAYNMSGLDKLTDGEALKPFSEVFLQGSEQCAESLGEKFDDLAPHTIVRRLMDHLYE
jgi:hypothetical protein